MQTDQSTDTGKDAADQEDLKLLFPEVEVEVVCPDTNTAVTVTVRELTFAEQLRTQSTCKTMIEALAEAAVDGETDPLCIDAAIGVNGGLWISAIAAATGHPETWLERLRGRDSMRLSDAMWETNGYFFVSKAIVRNALLARASDSEQHSTNSSGPDTPPANGKSRKNTRKGRSSGSGRSPSGGGSTPHGS